MDPYIPAIRKHSDQVRRVMQPETIKGSPDVADPLRKEMEQRTDQLSASDNTQAEESLSLSAAALVQEYRTCEILKAPYPITTDTKRRRDGWRAHIWDKYGLTEDKVVEMLKEQKFRCAVCGTKDPYNRNNFYTPWCVDHDHVDGHVRGILCEGCNYGIGLLGDTLGGLALAVNYLERDWKKQKDSVPDGYERMPDGGLQKKGIRCVMATEAIDTSKMNGANTAM